LAKWLIQLSAATVLLAVGIQFAERYFSPPVRLGLSVVFGLIWVIAGLKAVLLRSKGIQGSYAAVERNIRIIGILLLVFGLLWIGVSYYQFESQAKQIESRTLDLKAN